MTAPASDEAPISPSGTPRPVGREEVADDGDGDWQQRSGSDGLKHTRGDEPGQIRGERRRHGASHEYQHRGDVEVPVTPDIGHPAYQGHSGYVAEQVAGDSPGGAVKLVHLNVEVQEYLGEDRNDDGLVVSRDEYAGQDGQQREIARTGPSSARFRRGRQGLAAVGRGDRDGLVELRH